MVFKDKEEENKLIAMVFEEFLVTKWIGISSAVDGEYGFPKDFLGEMYEFEFSSITHSDVFMMKKNNVIES